MPAAANKTAPFAPTFAALKQLLAPYEKKLRVMDDTPTKYTLGGTLTYNGKRRETSLLAVWVMKNYVSLHLVPIYACPETVADISSALASHKQGKGCFNFTEPDKKLFAEVGTVIKKSMAACKAKGLL